MKLNSKYSAIGIAGVAKCGKNTFASLLIKRLSQFGYSAKEYALASELKNRMNPFLKEFCNVDIWNCSPEEKELVRPLLVAGGLVKRIVSDGKYWTSLIQEAIDADKQKQFGLIPIVTDIRYDQYPEDEVAWIKNQGGLLFHITRFAENGERIGPANETERENDPKVHHAADLKIVAQNVASLDLLMGHVDKVIGKYFEK